MSETGVKYDKGFLCQILLLPNVMSETGRNLSYYRVNMYLNILEPGLNLQISQPPKIAQNWFCT